MSRPQHGLVGNVPAPSAAGRPGGLGRVPELAYAAAAIVAVTALYGVAYSQAGAFPTASSLVGHGIGVAGFILMLLTAALYPLRKLRTDARWGRTSGWLKFHMVTGLVGPYMVLLHTAMSFSGLAGLTMLLTLVVVASGVVGRYLYTRVPRTVQGPDAAAGAGGEECLRPAWRSGARRSPPGTPSTCRSRGSSSSPPSSTWWRRSTTRRCSARARVTT